MSATLKELSDRLTAIVPHVPPMCRIEAKFIAAEMRSIEARPESVKPHTGTRLLTRDLVWCECGRGLSTAGVWTYCPRCGHPIDQEAYQGACEAAARLRGFVIEGDEFLRDKIAILAAEAAPVLTTATPLPVLRDNGGSNFCLKCHAEFGSEHPLCCDEGTTANGSINGVCAKCCDGRLHGKDEDAAGRLPFPPRSNPKGRKLKPDECGTYRMYRRGCRCEPCCQVKRESSNRSYARKVAKTLARDERLRGAASPEVVDFAGGSIQERA